ncbi:ribonuclease H-like domain-containing protein [Bacillus sp. FSL W8-0102]|uniref:ribonuclease H-like domain-containing protein n=1 Tax=Bacillus sp. FSL W8-0102 TaxID=2978205 RepID=UPI0030F5E891
MSLSSKLQRMKSHLVRDKEVVRLDQNPPKMEQEEEKEIPYLDEWRAAGAEPYFFDHQYCLIRRSFYSLDHRHGKYSFRELIEAVRHWNQWDGDHPLSAKGLSHDELFFFDTETTGLGHGAGNTIFLLGHARVLDHQVEVVQHILPEPGYEIALYQSFLENIDYQKLVTYNGKAFDWPQVKTRHTLIREHVPKLPEFGHFDLFHAARRMWKEKLESVKLSNVEKSILGIDRKDDVPGYLAPMIYFDYVERKKPDGMIGILKHNEHDILSLISLYIHLTYQILGLVHQTENEKYQVAKWFHYIGENKQAMRSLEDLVEEKKTDSSVDFRAKQLLAKEYKKEKQYEKAVPLWLEIAEKGSIAMKKEALIELSKYYEHKEKNLEAAYSFAEKALDHYKRWHGRTGKEQMETNDLYKRLERIRRKLLKNQEWTR